MKRADLVWCLVVVSLWSVGCRQDPELAKREHFESGKREVQRHEYRAALIEFQTALKFDPKFGEAWTRNQSLGVMAMPGVRLTIAAMDDDPAGFALVRCVAEGFAPVPLLALTKHPLAARGMDRFDWPSA